MRMPGLTAAASLYQTGERYSMVVAIRQGEDAIRPAHVATYFDYSLWSRFLSRFRSCEEAGGVWVCERGGCHCA